MVLFNLCGGPGAGKTTLSWYLGYRLKKAGVKVELTGEASRPLIYGGYPSQPPQQLLDNQLLMVGTQYEQTLRLKRHGFEAAISDSPIIQCLLYCEGQVYYDNLKKTIRDVESHFEMYNVLIQPKPGSYDPESRTQRTEDEARAFDDVCRKLIGHFWLEMNWDEEELLAEKAIEILRPQEVGHPTAQL